MGAFIDNNGAVQHRPAPGGWWEWQARQVAAAHQAQAAGGQNNVGGSMMASQMMPPPPPPANVHPAYYAQYYAHLGMTGMAPYQVMPNGLVPPSPRAPASPPQDAFAHHASPLMMSSGAVSTDSGKTSSSSSPGASNAPSPMSGFFRPSVPTSTVSGYGMASGSPLDGKHRRSSRGGRGSRAARARRRSAERAGQTGDNGGDESNGGE